MFHKMPKRVLVLVMIAAGVFVAGGCKGKSREPHIVEEELFLPGLKEEYDLLFVTDTHVVVLSEEDSEKERAHAQERKQHFVDAEGVFSAQQFPAWIDHANETRPDAVLFGGDVIDSPVKGNLELLEEQLGRLSVPYLYTPGNHDWTQPWEYMTKKAAEEYLPMLQPFMNDSPHMQCLDVGELRIIAVDNSSGQIHDAAIGEYEKLLQTDKRVIVLLHVPLITQSVLGRAREVWSSPVVLGGGNYGGIYPNETSERFFKLTTAWASPVELVLAGHVHFYDKDYIDGEKRVLQIVGPAGYEGSAVHLRIRTADAE